MKPVTAKLILWLGGATFISLIATLVLWLSPAIASEAAEKTSSMPADVIRWGLLAAALSTGASSLAAGYAVSNVGSAAIGALAENPGLIGRILIVIGLAEGIAIYGLIISVLILNSVL